MHLSQLPLLITFSKSGRNFFCFLLFFYPKSELKIFFCPSIEKGRIHYSRLPTDHRCRCRFVALLLVFIINIIVVVFVVVVIVIFVLVLILVLVLVAVTIK